MPAGGGKYEELCAVVKLGAKAECAIVIVLGGNRGSGFSMQANDPLAVLRVPKLLRDMADSIAGDVAIMGDVEEAIVVEEEENRKENGHADPEAD